MWLPVLLVMTIVATCSFENRTHSSCKSCKVGNCWASWLHHAVGDPGMSQCRNVASIYPSIDCWIHPSILHRISIQIIHHCNIKCISHHCEKEGISIEPARSLNEGLRKPARNGHVNGGFWVQKLSGFRSFACVVSSCLAKFIHNKLLLTTCRVPAYNIFTWWKLSINKQVFIKFKLQNRLPSSLPAALIVYHNEHCPSVTPPFLISVWPVKTECLTNV